MPESPPDDRMPLSFEEISLEGHRHSLSRDVAVEAPVAVEINGIAFAVMMATPTQLEDFAVGFANAEGLIDSADDILDLDIAEVPAGHIVRLRIGGAMAEAAAARVRNRVTESACGLCGVESLEALSAPLPRIGQPVAPSAEAVFKVLEAIRELQPLAKATGAAHAAALCAADGSILVVREDVGRHNALDKLVGACLRNGHPMQGHFAFVTSRLSFELVEKAVLAGIGGLVSASAPTSLALKRAEEAGLPVITRARPQSMLSTSFRP